MAKKMGAMKQVWQMMCDGHIAHDYDPCLHLGVCLRPEDIFTAKYGIVA